MERQRFSGAISGAKILLVEDDPTCMTLLTEYLKSKGYDVIAARNGQQAIASLSDSLPDLIVSDLMMPKMDGFAFLQQVKQDINTSWIPFILLSAKSLASDRIRGLGEGASAYLVKPFRLSELVAQVEALLRSSYALRENTLRQAEQRIQAPTDVKLTNSELSVAKLVAQGLTNFEIAQRLVTSKRTVESHISNMLRKTELSNRTELSRWILENGMA